MDQQHEDFISDPIILSLVKDNSLVKNNGIMGNMMMNRFQLYPQAKRLLCYRSE